VTTPADDELQKSFRTHANYLRAFTQLAGYDYWPNGDDDGEDDAEKSGESKILRLFENPHINSQSLSDYFRKLFGSSRSPGHGAPGAALKVRSDRRADAVGPNARPLPTPIQFTADDKPGAAMGVGGALYPEWDG